MHLTPSDPDISTLYRKISTGRLDLQPSFQRGEVWGKGKKQRLIDSILRGWHIPPIHVIQIPGTDKQEVLDGQQRLAAIRDFMEGGFPINGLQDPSDSRIMELDGFYWDDLPDEIIARVEDFTIRVLTISDYEPGEPGELFYRLNQPTNLTSAEQRNAYFGEARQQVKDLTEFMIELGFSRELVGFSNSRMAYDDVISKFLLTLENKTLSKKITSNSVTSRYRESTGFDRVAEQSARFCLETLYKCLSARKRQSKLNKATISSWLLFIHQAERKLGKVDFLYGYFDMFETIRESTGFVLDAKLIPKGMTRSFFSRAFVVYQDRASSRVADTSSVILRDFILWLIFAVFFDEYSEKYKDLKYLKSCAHGLVSDEKSRSLEQSLALMTQEIGWGELL